MGDTFKNISDSTIFNRTTVEGAVSILRDQNNVEAASALSKLADFIQSSGNSEAAELLESLSQEVEKPQPRKSLMRAMWDGIQTALPAVTKMVDIASGITELVA